MKLIKIFIKNRLNIDWYNMKKKDKSSNRISVRFARKYILYYYAFFWVVLVLILLFNFND